MSDSRFEHRKSRATVKVCHADGTPVRSKPVEITQTKHQFMFGTTGFDALELVGGAVDGTAVSPERAAFLQERMDKILALHNFITLPFYLGRYEPEEGKPDQRRVMAAAKWFQEKGVALKGHPLCWHTVCAPWLMQYSNKDILRKSLERIERDVTAYNGLVDVWDVINEVVIMPIFNKYDNAITRVCKEIGRVSMVREVFTTAKKANPNATFLINDFDVSTNYEILIDGCLQAGIPIDVIGIQSHQHQGYWGAEKVHEVLERFSHFGLPVHFTENNLVSGDIMPSHIEDLNDWKVERWPSTPEGEDRQAREVVEMYSILFAHPSVEAITTWSPIDGGWLNAPAGLLHGDNSVKPSYEALMQKIKHDWWTKETLVTNENGEISVHGFRGDYAISCANEVSGFTLDGKECSINVTVQ